MRIAIIHRDRLYREALGACLEQVEKFSIVHSGSRPEKADIMFLSCYPALVILEFGLSRGARVSEDDLVPTRGPDVKTVVVGVPNIEAEILSCIEEEGASGYLLMDASLGDLIDNIKAILRGETLCSPRIARLAFGRVARLAHRIKKVRVDIPTCFTRREEEIAILIDEGLRNKEIAGRLHIEVSTVKNHIHNILHRPQVNDRRSFLILCHPCRC